jgi:hypothetical protein
MSRDHGLHFEASHHGRAESSRNLLQLVAGVRSLRLLGLLVGFSDTSEHLDSHLFERPVATLLRARLSAVLYYIQQQSSSRTSFSIPVHIW